MKQEIHLTGIMMILVLLGVIFSLVCLSDCQSSTLVINVVEIKSGNNGTFVCSVSSAENLTRWNYLSGSTESSLMSFQNGICSVSPSDSFLTTKKYSYTCTSTVYQITIYNVQGNNIILACRDALRPDDEGFTWIIKSNQDNGTCSYCDPTITFDVMEVIEGDNVKFVCIVSSDVAFVTWDINVGSKTAAMGVENDQCQTQPYGKTFLDNTNTYFYNCNNTMYHITRLNVQISEHNDIYMCIPSLQKEGTGSNWIIKVKAPVKSVTIATTNSLTNVIENTVVYFTCTTSVARPAAFVYWYIHPNGNSNNITQIRKNITTATDYKDLSVTTSTLSFVPTRLHNNTKIFCEANNSVNTNQVQSNSKELQNVLYKADDPYVHQGNEYRVIENTREKLTCSVKGGNPAPSLSWSCNNFSSANQTTVNPNGSIITTLNLTAIRNQDGTCTCTSQQTGFQNETIDISLVVLYPPSQPKFEVNGSYVTGDIKFVEGKTRSIKCTADSKPSPDKYAWTGPGIVHPINKDTLIFNEIKNTDSGEYKCSAHNTMNSSSGGSVAGINDSTVNVVVLYPPMVKHMKNVSELKGKHLNLTCNFTPGMPVDTLINWTRNIDNNKWNTTNLSIMSLKKNDTGTYTCTAFNTMEESGDAKHYTGQHNQSFYLDVLYEANITSFTVNGSDDLTKTVNESDPVSFVCQTDSNPTAVMALSHGSKILNNLTSNSLEYNLVNASCLDAGIYFCSTQNRYNGDNGVNATVQLFVNCRPRIQNVVDRNITSEINETITIVLNVIAYPPPIFTWYQLVDENWTLLNDGDNYVMNSSNLQSKLTIHKVGREDFTSYRVNVTNDLGEMEQFYSLTPYDKPDRPSQFRHIEDYATTSSIHLEWKPGFDNGPSQTFYVKYRKSSDTKWNYLIVADNGGQTMELTLSELTADTQYDIVIFASNEKGNSSESEVVVARTQAIDKPPPLGALIGGIAGGVAGCIIFVIVIIVIIRRYPVFKRKGANEPGIRRSVSDDSDEDDGLVDNPMYVSSNNVASAVPSSSGVTATRQKPKQANSTSNEDLYTVVNKTKKQGSVQKGKTSTGKNAGKEVDVYENVELVNKPAQNDGTKQSSQQNAPTSVPKLKVVNKDGLIYADLVFNDKPPGEKMVINGDDPTPYALVDFTKKAEPLPESDNDDEK